MLADFTELRGIVNAHQPQEKQQQHAVQHLLLSLLLRSAAHGQYPCADSGCYRYHALDCATIGLNLWALWADTGSATSSSKEETTQ